MIDNKYYQELASLSTLTEEQILAEYSKYQQGDERALNRIIEANLRLVVHLAKHYRDVVKGNEVLDIGDLISAGNIGLIEAARRFNTSVGTKFSYYASVWIRKEIIALLRMNINTIRLPYRKVLIDDGEDIIELTRAVRMPDWYDPMEDESETNEEMIGKIKVALKHLKPKERKIIMLSYGIDCERKTLESIGDKLNYSKQWVGQLRSAALTKIKNMIN